VADAILRTNTIAAGMMVLRLQACDRRRSNAPMRIAERLGRILHRSISWESKNGSAVCATPDRARLRPCAAPHFGGSRAQLFVERIHDPGIGAAAIDGKRDLAGNDVSGGIGDDSLADGADPLGPCFLAMFSIASTISANVAARRGHGIGVEPAWLSNPVILRHTTTRPAGIDHADAFAFRFKDRALLDMQFDEA